MKKILNIFAIVSLVTSTTSSVVSCSHNNNPGVTKQQEEIALINFAQKYGIQKKEINKNNWSFQNQSVIDEKENIDFSFEENHNVKDSQKHSQLLKEFDGKMIYDLENKTFSLNGEPFKKPILIPGYWQPSLHKPSTITGNANDFTIAVGYDDLRDLSSDLSRPDTQTLLELFTAMHWKNVAHFKGLTVPDLESLQKTVWRLPDKGYMALIHVVKTKNGTYSIAWTNLDSDQDRHSLLEPDGDISSIFWKDINNKGIIQYHLWCNQELVQEISQVYQLYVQNPKQNPWFQNDNLNQWLVDKSIDPQTQQPRVGVQTINTTLYSNYNTSNDMADKALQSLNNSNFASWVQDHHYKNYDLVFNKDFSFNAKDSQELN